MSAAELEDEPVAAPPSELGAEPAATPAEELPVEQVAAPVVELGEEPIAMPAELEVEPVGHPIVEPVAEAEENLPLAGAPPSAVSSLLP